jgi:hypothetical protein
MKRKDDDIDNKSIEKKAKHADKSEIRNDQITTTQDDNWLLRLNNLINIDQRVGWPLTIPQIADLQHGWLMEANKEVLTSVCSEQTSNEHLSVSVFNHNH